MAASAKQERLEADILSSDSFLYVEGLLDCVTALVDDLKYPIIRKSKNVAQFLDRYESTIKNIRQYRIRYSDFDLIQVIGRGAYGEVQLVRKKDTKELFALKLLSKTDVLKRSDTMFFWEEREIMAQANSEWIVKLYYAFQDEKYLYMAMEFLQGGDMTVLLPEDDEDATCLSESTARFYIAELTLALEHLHKMGFVHRDVKPENCLIDSKGHLKLADFGTCIRVDPKTGRVTSTITLGTPDYISPEMLLQQGRAATYGPEIDWWSVGVIQFELLCGYTPFAADSLTETYSNIMNFTECFENRIDEGLPQELSKDCLSLIRAFLSDSTERLGRDGASNVKNHPFFATSDWTWETIRKAQAPFPIDLNSETDTRYFMIEDQEPQRKAGRDFLETEPKAFQGNNLPFIGFSFRSEPWFSSANTGSNSTVLSGELEKLRSKDQQLTEEIAKVRETASLAQLALKDAERQLTEAKGEKDKLEQKLSNVLLEQEDSVKLKHETQKYEQKIQSLNSLLDNIKLQLEEEKKAVKSAQSALEKTCLERDNLERELDETMSTLTQKTEEYFALKDKLEAFEATYKQEIAEITSTKDGVLQSLQEQIKKVNSEKELLRRQCEELNHEKEDLERKFRQAEWSSDSKSENESSKQKLTHELEEMNEKLTSVRAELRKSKDEEVKLMNLLADEKEQAKTIKSEILSAEKEAEKRKAEITTLSKTLSDQKTSLEQVQAQAKNYSDLLKAKTNELKDLKEKYDENSCFLELYKSEVDEVKKNSVQKTSKLEEKLTSLNFEIQKLKNGLNSAEKEAADEKSSRLKMSDQLSALEKEKLQIQFENERVLKKCKDLEANVSSLQADFDSANQKSKKLEDEKVELQAKFVKLQKEKDTEVMLKIQAVDRLFKFMNDPKAAKEYMRNKRNINVVRDNADGRKKDKDNKKLRELEAELQNERKKVTDIVSNKESQIMELQMHITELQTKSQDLMLEIEQKEAHIADLEKRLGNSANSDNLSIVSDGKSIIYDPSNADLSFEGILCIPTGRSRKKMLWDERWVVLNNRSLTFWKSKEIKEQHGQLPETVLEFSKIFGIRSQIIQTDALHSAPEDLKFMMQLLYEADGEATKKSKDALLNVPSPFISYVGHKMTQIICRMHTICDFCEKPCYSLLNPPPVLECNQCHVKIHKEHYDLNESVTHCKVYEGAKVQLLRCKAEADKVTWVKEIEKRLRKPSRHKDNYASGRGRNAVSREASTASGKFSVSVSDTPMSL